MRRQFAAWSMLTVLVAVVVAAHAQQTQTPTPRFRSGVEAIPVDVTVIDDRGKALTDVLASEFVVKIDGRPRRVIDAEWLGSPVVQSAPSAPTPPLPEGYQSNQQALKGRLIVLAVDQPNINPAASRPMQNALTAFVDRLGASDLVAIVGFGPGPEAVSFTTDRARIKRAIGQMRGRQAPLTGTHPVGLSSAITLERNGNVHAFDTCEPRCRDDLLDAIVTRDCPDEDPIGRPGQRTRCKGEILNDVHALVANVRRERDIALRGMEELLTGLKNVDASKTVLLVSQRLVVDLEREGTARIASIAALADEARTTIYTIRMDDEHDVAQARLSSAPQEDVRMARQGLDMLATSAGGGLFNMTGTQSMGVFDRIVGELSGYYVLGVEPESSDTDGKPHDITVSVTRRGATVRGRRAVVAGQQGAQRASRSPRDAAIAALAMALPASAVPLRSVAYAFRGADDSMLQLIVRTDVGSGYTSPGVLAVAYAVRDADGRTLDARFAESRFDPSVPGVPSPLVCETAVSVPPGDYTVKLAVADGDRVGTIEVAASARLTSVGVRQLSPLVVGAPVPPGQLLQPTMNLRVSYGLVHAYFEAYGENLAQLKTRFDIVADATGAVLQSTDTPVRTADATRAVFASLIPVPSLPPGAYRLQAVVSDGDAPLTTMTRAFEVAREADSGGAATAPATSSRFTVTVNAKDLAPPFALPSALEDPVLKPFRDRVAPAALAAFDQGLGHLRAQRYPDAEMSLRRALRDDTMSVGTLAYLGVCFAASGHDAEAVRVWKTALALDNAVPQLHAWLGESQMRAGLFADARTLFEKATERWPADTRFARPLALLHASFGDGREAVMTMERFLEDHPADARSLYLAIEWMVSAQRAAAVVREKADDVRRVREYSARYLATDPPDAAIVRQWLEYLKEK